MTLILGGSGQLGTAFCSLLPGAAAPDRSQLDLAEPTLIRDKILRLKPSRIINCAAYTDVDAAETDEENAMLINAVAVGEIAAAAQALEVPFVTISTDYVFDGASRDPYVESGHPNPINAYGRSKLAGERLALAYHRSLIVRTSWLMSATHPNFVAAIIDRVMVGPMRVVDDEWGRPTLAGDLAEAVLSALEMRAAGVLHLANGSATSRWALAVAAAAAAGLDATRIEACSSDKNPRPAMRPKRAVLNSERLGSLGLGPMPDWNAGLARIAPEIRKRPKTAR
jgi:dTDP-4-dehydrorhamnose reductase